MLKHAQNRDPGPLAEDTADSRIQAGWIFCPVRAPFGGGGGKTIETGRWTWAKRLVFWAPTLHGMFFFFWGGGGATPPSTGPQFGLHWPNFVGVTSPPPMLSLLLGVPGLLWGGFIVSTQHRGLGVRARLHGSHRKYEVSLLAVVVISRRQCRTFGLWDGAAVNVVLVGHDVLPSVSQFKLDSRSPPLPRT